MPGDRGESISPEPAKSDTLILSQSLTILNAAFAKAEKIGVPSNVAIVDSGANLLAFGRMDGAWLGSIDIAQNKAYTARAFDMSTKYLAKISQPGDPAYGIAVSTNHWIAIFPGGVLIKAVEVIVGSSGRVAAPQPGRGGCPGGGPRLRLDRQGVELKGDAIVASGRDIGGARRDGLASMVR